VCWDTLLEITAEHVSDGQYLSKLLQKLPKAYLFFITLYSRLRRQRAASSLGCHSFSLNHHVSRDLRLLLLLHLELLYDSRFLFFSFIIPLSLHAPQHFHVVIRLADP